MRLNIRVLGSSSAGNCTLIWDNSSAVMVDCGFTPKYILNQLDLLSLGIGYLSGVIITHTHGDHVNKAMMKVLNRAKVPVYCHERIRRDLVHKYVVMGNGHNPGLVRTFTEEEITLGKFRIKSFEVPHDSTGGCFGFNILKELSSGVKKVTLATDIGYYHDEIIGRFIDSDVIVVESNHDIEMLENSGRPQYLKQRIKEIGHLSNMQCAELLSKVVVQSDKKPEAVILAHISQQCNTSALARMSALNVLDNHGLNKTKLLLTHKAEANEIFSLE
ncbi:MAG: MBL fold metallo-hydrolase [Ignavibacteriales bacterium]